MARVYVGDDDDASVEPVEPGEPGRAQMVRTEGDGDQRQSSKNTRTIGNVFLSFSLLFVSDTRSICVIIHLDEWYESGAAWRIDLVELGLAK